MGDGGEGGGDLIAGRGTIMIHFVHFLVYCSLTGESSNIRGD